MHKNRRKQAIRAMYAVLDAYKRKPDGVFPLAIRRPLFSGVRPYYRFPAPDIKDGGIWTSRFGQFSGANCRTFAAGLLGEITSCQNINRKVLAPSFSVSTLEDKIKMFNHTAKRILTESRTDIR